MQAGGTEPGWGGSPRVYYVDEDMVLRRNETHEISRAARSEEAPRTISGLSLRLIRARSHSAIGKARPPSRSCASRSGRTCLSFSRPARKARRCSRQPSDTASVQIRVPSARNQPVWRRYFRSCNARRRFTSAFAALVIGSGSFTANISCHNKTKGKPIFYFDCDPFLRT